MPNPNPKCPECGHAPYQAAICQKNNPLWKCFYAHIVVHTHYYCGNKNCNCMWIGF